LVYTVADRAKELCDRPGHTSGPAEKPRLAQAEQSGDEEQEGADAAEDYRE
jgi:hypothetical protein